MASPVEAIGAIGSGSNQSGGSYDPSSMNGMDPSPVSYQPRWVQALQTPNAAHTYSCFMLMLLSLNNLAMGNINGSALAQSNLMNTEQAIQKNLVTISSFLSQIQQNSTADSSVYGSLGISPSGSPTILTSPEAFNGLAHAFYDISNNEPSFGEENPSSTYIASMASFVQAFKEIFYANSDSSAPTVASLSEIYNPNVYQNGQGFNLTSFWNGVNQTYTDAGYNQIVNGTQYNIVGTHPDDTASLLQQYMFYRAQVTVDTGSISEVDGANGQIQNLVNFNAPTSSNTACDPFIVQTVGLITSLNTTQTVSRENLEGVTVNSTTSGNLLQMILNNDVTQTTPYSGGQGDLYSAFSYMAFNDYWTKNPAGNSSETVTAPVGGPNGWSPFLTSNWDWGNPISSVGDAEGDTLASLTTTVNGIQTNAGSVTSDDSVTMQELSANESSYVNIGQNMLQNLDQSFSQWSQNQISN